VSSLVCIEVENVSQDTVRNFAAVRMMAAARRTSNGDRRGPNRHSMPRSSPQRATSSSSGSGDHAHELLPVLGREHEALHRIGGLVFLIRRQRCTHAAAFVASGYQCPSSAGQEQSLPHSVPCAWRARHGFSSLSMITMRGCPTPVPGAATVSMESRTGAAPPDWCRRARVASAPIIRMRSGLRTTSLRSIIAGSSPWRTSCDGRVLSDKL